MGKQYWKPGNLLYPLPAVMVSAQRPGEKPNIITLAWAGTVCSDPVMVSISIRPERYTYGIVKETGEFVVNLVTRGLTFATDFCGVRSGRDVDKFQEMNLTPIPSKYVAAPSIAESPVNLECKVERCIPYGSHDVFLAHVLGVTVDEAYLDGAGKLDLNKADLMAYSHGEYFALGEKLGKFGYSVQKK
ncbi:MAG: flavin reductase family protein [Lachnospiraceae bacterium]|jgi:flavin reductase (DIM6/NTAB) family NADH-FMN oxidoreductase RutF|nr:flavin reductase family protein [Lachnospiraceae bacterium]